MWSVGGLGLGLMGFSVLQWLPLELFCDGFVLACCLCVFWGFSFDTLGLRRAYLCVAGELIFFDC